MNKEFGLVGGIFFLSTIAIGTTLCIFRIFNPLLLILKYFHYICQVKFRQMDIQHRIKFKILDIVRQLIMQEEKGC